jgi:uncharacterized protein
MQVLRAQDYRRMPWKNGGGETIEIALSPAGASFETFDWRISMARVGASGPFSLFPGIDRTLCMIEGIGLSLTFGDGERIFLNRQSDPFCFSGDRQVDGVLVSGPIDDLNVMTRRNHFTHRVSRHAITTLAELDWRGDVGIVVAIRGGLDIRTARQAITLEPTDALIFVGADAQTFTATARSDADLFLIDIWKK